MSKLYKKPVTEALPDISLPEPRFSKFAVFVLRLLGRPYLCLFIGLARIRVRNGKPLFDAFRRALAGESRCIIAFRHSYGTEPQILSWFFLFRFAALAARSGVRFTHNKRTVKPHALFVYGYEVARWGGLPARLIMPNIGAMPVHHAKMDSAGMARIRKAIAEGPWPLALAPEGQVSYTTDTVPRLEGGAIRIGFEAARELAAKGVDVPVEILPLSFHFRYGRRGKAAMERLLRKIEKYCGFTSGVRGLTLSKRLGKCRNYILELNEKRYAIHSDTSLSFEQRLEKVTCTALEYAGRMLGIKTEGDYFQRLYKIRQICWDKIFVPGVTSLKKIPPAQRSVMDLDAGEAWYISRHQELADFGWYFRRPLPTDESALHNQIEYVQNLWDFLNRSMGGAFADRKNIFPETVIIQAAPAINLSSRLSQYKENRKDTIAACLSNLEKAYLDTITEINNERP